MVPFEPSADGATVAGDSVTPVIVGEGCGAGTPVPIVPVATRIPGAEIVQL
jgi:hypothetical protein